MTQAGTTPPPHSAEKPHLAPPTHSLQLPQNRPPLLIRLEASLTKINDLIVAKFNGHFFVLIAPSSSAGFDMVDHSSALESFSSLSFYDNTFWFSSSLGTAFQCIGYSRPHPAPATTPIHLTNSCSLGIHPNVYFFPSSFLLGSYLLSQLSFAISRRESNAVENSVLTENFPEPRRAAGLPHIQNIQSQPPLLPPRS